FQTSSQRDHLHHGTRSGKRIRPRRRDPAGNEDLPAIDLANDHRDVCRADVLARSRLYLVPQHLRRLTLGLYFTDQRNRDASIRPDRDIAVHVGLAPEDHAEHAFRTNLVASSNWSGPATS